jgi:glycerol-3-phosphate dehydrogenase
VPVLSVFAGLRPLAAPEKKRGKKTPKDLECELCSETGLITITGDRNGLPIEK